LLESELASLRAWAEKEQEQRASSERRVRELELELRAHEQRGHETQRDMSALEQRYHELQRESAMLRSADQRNQELQRENASLQSQVSVLESEKQQLELTIRTLQKDVTKLDSFKSTIIASIREDSAPYVPQTDTVRPASSGLHGSPPPTRLAPTREPYARSSPAGSAYGMGSLGASYPSTFAYPGGYSGAPPTARTHFSPPPGSSRQRTSPTASATYVDGKEFFRIARSRLSYEHFNAFLGQIKSLNDHTQSRDTTLEQARQIFGAENEDLFVQFRSLLAHHGLV